MTFFATRVNDTYSTSINDKTSIACFFEFHLTSSQFNKKIKPEVNLIMIWFLA